MRSPSHHYPPSSSAPRHLRPKYTTLAWISPHWPIVYYPDPNSIVFALPTPPSPTQFPEVPLCTQTLQTPSVVFWRCDTSVHVLIHPLCRTATREAQMCTHRYIHRTARVILTGAPPTHTYVFANARLSLRSCVHRYTQHDDRPRSDAGPGLHAGVLRQTSRPPRL